MPLATFMSAWLDVIQANGALIAKFVLQIFILIGLVYLIYNRFIRQSHAERLLKGVFVTLISFVTLWLAAHLLGFGILEIVFGASINILFIGLIVIFQPELRRMLLFLGQSELFGLNLFTASSKEQKAEFLIHELTEAVHFLSKSKRGALIVLESSNNPGGEYLEAGTSLNADLTTELLLTIFHPNTPLHDGAVVINPENRITAAGVLLPLTEDPELSWQYGTRHRAAIGLTEISNSRCIVISEETGSISVAYEGALEKMDSVDDLQKMLEKAYHVSIKGDGRRKDGMRDRVSSFFGVNALPDRLQKIFSHNKDGGEKAEKSGRKIS